MCSCHETCSGGLHHRASWGGGGGQLFAVPGSSLPHHKGGSDNFLSYAPSKTWIGDSFAWQRNSAWTNIEETKIALEVKVTFSFPGSWFCSSHDTLCLLWRSLGFHTWSYKVTRQMIITTNAIHAQTRPCKNPERPRRLSRNPIPDHSIPCRGS